MPMRARLTSESTEARPGQHSISSKTVGRSVALPTNPAGPRTRVIILRADECGQADVCVCVCVSTAKIPVDKPAAMLTGCYSKSIRSNCRLAFNKTAAAVIENEIIGLARMSAVCATASQPSFIYAHRLF